MIPPSVNHYWGKKGRQWYTLKRAREFKEIVAWTALSRRKNRETISLIRDKNVKISVTVYVNDRRRRDIDNMLKGVLDALKGVVYDDDAVVTSLRIEKKPASQPKTVIIVEGLE